LPAKVESLQENQRLQQQLKKARRPIGRAADKLLPRRKRSAAQAYYRRIAAGRTADRAQIDRIKQTAGSARRRGRLGRRRQVGLLAAATDDWSGGHPRRQARRRAREDRGGGEAERGPHCPGGGKDPAKLGRRSNTPAPDRMQIG